MLKHQIQNVYNKINKEKYSMSKEKLSFENVELNKNESSELLKRLANNDLTEKDLESLFNSSETVKYINENFESNNNEK